MRLRAAAVALVLLFLLPAATPASATSPSDLAAAQARAAVIESVRAQLGSQLATALQTADRVAQALRDNASQQDVLNASIADSDAQILALEDEIAKLDVEMENVSQRIRVEKAQIGSIARTIYAQPSSVLLLMVESKSLGDMITRVNDLRSAGSRAQTLKSKLKDDLAQDRHRPQEAAGGARRAGEAARPEGRRPRQAAGPPGEAGEVAGGPRPADRLHALRALPNRLPVGRARPADRRHPPAAGGGHHRGRRVLGLEPGRGPSTRSASRP